MNGSEHFLQRYVAEVETTVVPSGKKSVLLRESGEILLELD